MPIKHVSIAGLFGTFDHEIPLFDPLTIVYGPNGVGKTSILRLIHSALRSSYTPLRPLRHIPFRELAITLDDDSVLRVTPELSKSAADVRRPSRRGARPPRIQYHLLRDGQVVAEFTDSEPHALSVGPRLDHYLPHFVHRIPGTGGTSWVDSRTDTFLDIDQVLDAYSADIPETFRPAGKAPWLLEIQRRTPVHFIETQRLLDTRSRRPPHSQSHAAIRRCAADFADTVKSALAQYATLSQAQDSSFPARVISQAGVAMTEDEIRARLAGLEKQRARLADAGLLDPTQDLQLPAKFRDETTKRVLAVYVTDTETKLRVLDDLLHRIEVIKSIVDARFLQKRFAVSSEHGFLLLSRDGTPVELSDLSSGEQHELVLLYELLFRAESRTLILIDEPELSLHVAWQQQFLRDLLKIATLAKLQSLVATHSPQIIHDRWDLAVELSGPK